MFFCFRKIVLSGYAICEGRSSCDRDLIKQQLKEVIILPVNQRDFDRSCLSWRATFRPPKPAPIMTTCVVFTGSPIFLPNSLWDALDLCHTAAASRLGSLVEVGNGIPATHSLYPDILDAGEIRCLIICRDEHPRGEGLVISIALPIEIGNHTTVLPSVTAVFSGSLAAPVHLNWNEGRSGATVSQRTPSQ